MYISLYCVFEKEYVRFMFHLFLNIWDICSLTPHVWPELSPIKLSSVLLYFI